MVFFKICILNLACFTSIFTIFKGLYPILYNSSLWHFICGILKKILITILFKKSTHYFLKKWLFHHPNLNTAYGGKIGYWGNDLLILSSNISSSSQYMSNLYIECRTNIASFQSDIHANSFSREVIRKTTVMCIIDKIPCKLLWNYVIKAIISAFDTKSC